MSSVASSRLRTAVAGVRGVSRYDRVAGLIVALVILLGLVVGVLLFVWLAGVWRGESGHVVPAVFHPGEGGDPQSFDDAGLKLEAPSLTEIQRETDLPLPGLRHSLTLVDQLVKTRSAELLELEQDLQPPTAGGGAARGEGERARHGEGAGSGGVHRGQRWEIAFAPGISLDEYRRQLDFFHIELAAFDAGANVEYVTDLIKHPPTLKPATSDRETRLYMSWREGSPRREADRKLMEEAGVRTAGKQLVQFLPPEVEAKLAELEIRFADRDPRTIRKTRFGVRPQGAGFEFYVAEQYSL